MSKGLQIAIALEHIYGYFLVKCTEKNGNIPIGTPLTLLEILFLKNHINNGKQIILFF